MRRLWIILALCIFGGTSHAKDNYPNLVWGTTFNINPNVRVKSAKVLTKHQQRIMRDTYTTTEQKFFKYWDIDRNMCRLNPLEVVVVKSHHELNDREKFPDETAYADKPGEGNNIIFGRYYVYLDKLFIIPVLPQKYFWRANFSHEVLHYLFDECGVEFESLEEEHAIISDFLEVHRDVFY